MGQSPRSSSGSQSRRSGGSRYSCDWCRCTNFGIYFYPLNSTSPIIKPGPKSDRLLARLLHWRFGLTGDEPAGGVIERTVTRVDAIHRGTAATGRLRDRRATVTGRSRVQRTRGGWPTIGPPGGVPTAAARPADPSRAADRLSPDEQLTSLPGAADDLTQGTPVEQLATIAVALRDTDAARAVETARPRLFRSIDPAA